jgi:putative oxygen-independent coproporphyrinogen III oxidase
MQKAGVYIHIPFCLSRCSYCDFATDMYRSDDAKRYIAALVHELGSWSEVDQPPAVDAIYFGGGTPSLLSPAQVEQILVAVKRKYEVNEGAEITMEMNPGSAGSPQPMSADLESPLDVIRSFREIGINRVSFGAQTFHDRELARLGRTHTAEEARQTFRKLRQGGFRNISFDLIAGLPGQSLEEWQQNVDQALALRPEHLSFYLLEVHEGTPLAEHIKRGIQPRPDDDLAAEMYRVILDRACAEGYEHYEISNLCLPGFASRHNTKYWTRAPYYGFGCSSHSYDGQSCRWRNERALTPYLDLAEHDISPIAERVMLNEDDVRAESIFLGLRLMRGISLRQYQQRFGVDLLTQRQHEVSLFSDAGLIRVDGDVLSLTRSGALLSNEVFSAFV